MARKMDTSNVLTLPIAPMVDISFQLLVFFVFTYQEDMPEVHLSVNLPSRGKAEIRNQAPPAILTVTVQPNQYYLSGAPIPFNDLRDFLFSLDAKDTTVVIQVNRRANAQEVVSVLDACKYASLANLNLMTLK